MNNEKLIESIVREVLESMTDGKKGTPTTITKSQTLVSEYPFGYNVPEKIATYSGKKLSDLTLSKVISGEVTNEDIKISAQTLEMQSDVAKAVNREAFARNLERAAELIEVPDDRVLEIYDALRPYRSTKQELLDIANELEQQYQCKINANFIRQAADVYEQRGRLKK